VAFHPRWFKYAWLAAPWAGWLLWHGEFEFVYLAVGLTFGGVVMNAVTVRSALLRSRPLRFVGKISYGMYILHPIVFGVFWLTPLYSRAASWPHPDLIRMIGQVLFPIPFAAASWYLFERPVLKLKRHFENSDREDFRAPARAPVLVPLAAD